MEQADGEDRGWRRFLHPGLMSFHPHRITMGIRYRPHLSILPSYSVIHSNSNSNNSNINARQSSHRVSQGNTNTQRINHRVSSSLSNQEGIRTSSDTNNRSSYHRNPNRKVITTNILPQFTIIAQRLIIIIITIISLPVRHLPQSSHGILQLSPPHITRQHLPPSPLTRTSRTSGMLRPHSTQTRRTSRSRLLRHMCLHRTATRSSIRHRLLTSPSRSCSAASMQA